MINLIPQRAKKSIRTEYWIRVVSVWLLLWSVALFAAASILLPTYVLIGIQVAGYEASATEASARVTEFGNTSASLIRSSQEAKRVIEEFSTKRFSEFIELFESLQGNDIQLTAVALSRDKGVLSPVSLKGVAANRQALASFRDRLMADRRVVSVDLPISNLTSDKDILFTIMVTMSNDKNI